MGCRSGKIKLVAVVLVVLAAAVGGYFAVRGVAEMGRRRARERFASLLAQSRERFLSMLPEGYDRSKATAAFDNFFRAAQAQKLRRSIVLKQLAPYLAQAIRDGRLTRQEADSVLTLMRRAVKP